MGSGYQTAMETVKYLNKLGKFPYRLIPPEYELIILLNLIYYNPYYILS